MASPSLIATAVRLADPKHTEHSAMMNWHDGPFDPDDIDLERINRRLAVISQRRQRTVGQGCP